MFGIRVYAVSDINTYPEHTPTTPNKVVGQYHDRMPVILDREVEEEWLNPDIEEPERLLRLLKQYPADKMEERQVNDAARNPKNDYPELIKPL
jgi:putative SOS response-associated peptidase YedK